MATQNQQKYEITNFNEPESIWIIWMKDKESGNKNNKYLSKIKIITINKELWTFEQVFAEIQFRSNLKYALTISQFWFAVRSGGAWEKLCLMFRSQIFNFQFFHFLTTLHDLLDRKFSISNISYIILKYSLYNGVQNRN